MASRLRVIFTLVPERVQVAMEFSSPESVTLATVETYLASVTGVSPPYRFVSRGEVVERDQTVADLHIEGNEGSVFYTRMQSRGATDDQQQGTLVTSLESYFMNALLENNEAMSVFLSRAPQVQALREAWPEVDNFLQDPQLVRQLFQAMRNPGMAREMIRTSDRALSRVDVIPGGMDALRQVYQEIQEPAWESLQALSSSGGLAGGDSSQDAIGGVCIPTPDLMQRTQEDPFPHPSRSSPLSVMLNAANNGGCSSSEAPPSLVLPTMGSGIEDHQQSMGFDLMRMMGEAAAAAAAASSSSSSDDLVVPPRIRYASQLAILKDMGYSDEERNIEALVRNSGNLNRTLDDLMGV